MQKKLKICLFVSLFLALTLSIIMLVNYCSKDVTTDNTSALSIISSNITMWACLIPVFVANSISYSNPISNLTYIFNIIKWKSDVEYRNKKISKYISDDFINSPKYETLLNLPEKLKYTIEKISEDEDISGLVSFQVIFENSKSYIVAMRLKTDAEKNKQGKYILQDISAEDVNKTTE